MVRRSFLLATTMAALTGCGDDTGGAGGSSSTSSSSSGGGDATSTTSGTGGGSADSYFRYTAKGQDVDIPLAGAPLFSVGPTAASDTTASVGLLAYDAGFTKTGAIAIYVPDSQTVPAGTYQCGESAALSAAVDGHRAGSGVNVGDGGSCTITLDVAAEPGATITGTFSGTLIANDQSDDPADLVLSNGSFKATIPAN